MPRFTDDQGESWEIKITAGTIKELLDSDLKIDLGKPDEGDPPLATRFDTDIALKVDLIHEVCRAQCEARGLKPIDFAHRLAGESLAAADAAFKEAWRDFFLPCRVDLAQVIERSRAWAAQLARTRAAKLSSAEHEEAMQRVLRVMNEEFDSDLNAPEQEIREAIRSALKRPGKPAADWRPSPAANPSQER